MCNTVKNLRAFVEGCKVGAIWEQDATVNHVGKSLLIDGVEYREPYTGWIWGFGVTAISPCVPVGDGAHTLAVRYYCQLNAAGTEPDYTVFNDSTPVNFTVTGCSAPTDPVVTFKKKGKK